MNDKGQATQHGNELVDGSLYETRMEIEKLREGAPPIPTYTDLEVDVLKSYLTSWTQGGGNVTTFTARGIFFMAQQLGISIVENSYVETSDGKAFYLSATAENTHTRLRYTANIRQSQMMRRGGKEVFDPDALAKGTTRVNRNALAGLLPVDLLKSRVQAAIKQGDIEKSALQQAQSKARNTLLMRKEELEKEFGLNPAQVFERAQLFLGSAEDWDAEAWEVFGKSVDLPRRDWYGITQEDNDEPLEAEAINDETQQELDY